MLSDGTVGEWIRPAIAYAVVGESDEVGDSNDGGSFYIAVKRHKHQQEGQKEDG